MGSDLKDCTDVPWEVRCCDQGPDCWCREIYTVEGDEVMPAGCVYKEFAEYVVELHNNAG